MTNTLLAIIALLLLAILLTLLGLAGYFLKQEMEDRDTTPAEDLSEYNKDFNERLDAQLQASKKDML